MDNGVLPETKTLVELIRHYTCGARCAYFPYFARASDIQYEARKFPAIFIVVVFENTNDLSFVYKRN